MAARKDQNGGSKPPPARARAKPIPREEPEDSLDAGWFDEDEAPTKFKDDEPKTKPKAKTSSRPPPAWEKPGPADKSPKSAEKKDKKADKAEKTTAERQRIANAAKLLPPPRRQTIEVQVDWLERVSINETTGKTIPVEAEWLEIVDEDEEPPTVARGRRTPVSPPPIPKAPPIPREAKKSEPPKKSARRSSAPPPPRKR